MSKSRTQGRYLWSEVEAKARELSQFASTSTSSVVTHTEESEPIETTIKSTQLDQALQAFQQAFQQSQFVHNTKHQPSDNHLVVPVSNLPPTPVSVNKILPIDSTQRSGTLKLAPWQNLQHTFVKLQAYQNRQKAQSNQETTTLESNPSPHTSTHKKIDYD